MTENRVVSRYPEVLSRVTEQTGITKKDTNLVLRAFLAHVHSETMAGRIISLVGFGAFFSRQGGGFVRGGHVARRSVRVCFRPSQTSRIYLEDEATPAGLVAGPME